MMYLLYAIGSAVTCEQQRQWFEQNQYAKRQETQASQASQGASQADAYAYSLQGTHVDTGTEP